MNVLSLFDGMSCGQIALGRLGIEPDHYYASEIDTYAMNVTRGNYPNTIFLGDVTKWREWNLPKIDLILAGTPCQGFSNSGKQLNFKDERSKLFFDFIEILKHYKPKYFLLENVTMKREWVDIISEYIGEVYPENITDPNLFGGGLIRPIKINSSRVSAQNRNRLYWTNIPNIKQPEDKKIFIKHILEDDDAIADIVVKCGTESVNSNVAKSYTLMARDYKGFGNQGMTGIRCRQVEIANGINGHDCLKRCYDINFKAPTLTTICGGNQEPKIAINNNRWRKLTPKESERLQTVDDDYTAIGMDANGKDIKISNSQRYKMLGNGWTVDVIAHILKNMEIEQCEK